MDYEILERLQEKEGEATIISPRPLQRRESFASNREVKMIYDITFIPQGVDATWLSLSWQSTPENKFETELVIITIQSKVLETPPQYVLVNPNPYYSTE